LNFEDPSLRAPPVICDLRRPSGGVRKGQVRSTLRRSRRTRVVDLAKQVVGRVASVEHRSEGTRSAAEGRMWEPAVLPTFSKKKVGRRKRRNGPAASPNRPDKPPETNTQAPKKNAATKAAFLTSTAALPRARQAAPQASSHLKQKRVDTHAFANKPPSLRERGLSESTY